MSGKTISISIAPKSIVLSKTLSEKISFSIKIKHEQEVRFKSLGKKDILSDSSFLLEEEKKYHKNIRHCFSLSRNLFEMNEYKDSFLYIHLGTELIFKYLYSKIKYSYKDRFDDDLPRPELKLHNSHDITAIISYLKRIHSFDEIREFKKLLSVMAKHKDVGRWQDIRYLVTPDDQFEVKQLRDFTIVLTKSSIRTYLQLRDRGYFK